MKRWALWIGIIIVIGAAGAGAYYYYFARDAAVAVNTLTSRTVKASRSDIEVKISGTGKVTADSRATVTARTSGTIGKLDFKIGDTVKQGQVLAVFESADVSNQISQIELSLKKQKLQMAQYESQYKESIGTDKEEATKQSVDNSIQLLKLDMDQNNKSLADIYKQQAEVVQVVAPISGKVTASAVAVGDSVQGNTVLAEIVDYTALSFVVQVDELDIPQLKVGQAAQVHLNAMTNKAIEGTVEELALEGTISSGVAAYDVTIGLSQIDGILAGMSGQVDIIIQSKKNVVVEPVDAVVNMRGSTFVRVPSTDTAGVTAGTEGKVGGQAEGGEQGQPNQQGSQVEQGYVGRPQSLQGTAQSGQRSAAGGSRAGGMQMEGTLVPVKIGISNEAYVEIESGLDEGASVLVPLPQGTVGTASSKQTQTTFPGGFGGMGGMQFPSGGGGGFTGGNGARTQGGGR